MKKEKMKPSKSEIKYSSKKVLSQYLDIQNENILPSIDDLLCKMKNVQLKSTSMKIFLLFKKYNYNKIAFDTISSQFLKEYESDPSNFLSYNQNQFTSPEKLLKSLSKSLTNGAFLSFKENNVSYVKLNPPKALEYLTTVYNKNYKDDSTKSSEANKKAKTRKKTVSINDKKTMNYKEEKYIGKKRKRKNKLIPPNYNVKDAEKESNDEDSKEDNKKTNESFSSENQDNAKGCDEGIKSLKKINMNNDIYFQGKLMSKNLSNLTFYDPTFEKIKNYSSYNSMNLNDSISNNESMRPNNENNEVILFRTKKEEEMYGLLMKEASPLYSKFDKIKEIINDNQEKCLSIEKNIKKMYELLDNYQVMKRIFKNNINNIKPFLKVIDIEIKTLNLLIKNEYGFPFRDEAINRHLEYCKLCLNEAQIIDENDGKIIKDLNDFGDEFSKCRKTVEKSINVIFENNYNLIPMKNIESLINPELIIYFQKLSFNEISNNEQLNDLQILYNENNKYSNIYKKYLGKYDDLELDNLDIDCD